jgi:hypothetical protein
MERGNEYLVSQARFRQDRHTIIKEYIHLPECPYPYPFRGETPASCISTNSHAHWLRTEKEAPSVQPLNSMSTSSYLHCA